MDRKNRHVLAVAMLAFFLAGTADTTAQTVLTFDDLDLPTGAAITDQYVDQGVLFSPLDGRLELRLASTPLFPDDPIGLAELPWYTSVIIADFLPGATSAGAWIDFGIDTIGNGVMIQAFGGPGGTGNLLGTAITTTESYVGLEVDGIQSVRFEKVPGGTTSFLIDHFTYSLVPEPGTLSLLVLGSVLLVRRRDA